MQVDQPSEKQLQRQQIRQYVRQQRQQLSPEQQQQASHTILETLEDDPQLKASQDIALYLAFDGEIDLQPLLDFLWQQQKNCYVPLIDPQLAGRMHFHRYHANSATQANRFGIKEPVFQSEDCIAVSQLDVILAPLVAFDLQGNRLGLGGGYYDRLLSQCKEQELSILGIAHDCQYIEHIPTESWDQPLGRIITPSKDWRFSR